MIVKGYASTSDLDHSRHIVAPSAFDATLRAKGFFGPKGIKLLWQHRHDKPLGRILKLEKRNKGLWIEAEIDEAISWGRDVAAAIKANGGLSFSIGFFIEDADIEERGPDSLPCLFIQRMELIEVSVVVFPCNAEAVMTDSNAPAPDPQIAAIQELTAMLAGLNRSLSS